VRISLREKRRKKTPFRFFNILTLSGGAQKKRKKEKEKEEAIKEETTVEEMERVKLGPSKLWTGLVLHHKDIFVSHVISKLNETDRCFFEEVNRESRGVLEYAGVDVSKLFVNVHECTSISTLEWKWNHMHWGEEDNEGNVIDQAWFCEGVAGTNKLEFLKWAREVKRCEWDEETIETAADIGNLEMLKYCISNGCPCDKKESCIQAACAGHLDCLRLLFEKVKPSRGTEKEVVIQATCGGHMEIVKYLVEERKIPEAVKASCVTTAAKYGHLDCINYLVDEAKVPLTYWRYIACARYYEHHECVNYLLAKGSPEPTDEEYARYVARKLEEEEQQQ
jgi:hypothetical protein